MSENFNVWLTHIYPVTKTKETFMIENQGAYRALNLTKNLWLQLGSIGQWYSFVMTRFRHYLTATVVSAKDSLTLFCENIRLHFKGPLFAISLVDKFTQSLSVSNWHHTIASYKCSKCVFRCAHIWSKTQTLKEGKFEDGCTVLYRERIFHEFSKIVSDGSDQFVKVWESEHLTTAQVLGDDLNSYVRLSERTMTHNWSLISKKKLIQWSLFCLQNE